MVAVALLTVTLWAGTVIATKVAVAEMEPLAAALSRAWLAGLLALPLAVLSLKERPRGAPAWRGLAAAASVLGDLLVLAGCAAAAFGYVAGARAASSALAWQVTLWGMVFAGLLLLPGLALVDLSNLLEAGRDAWLGIGYLALVSSLMGYALWYWALAKGGIARVGSFQFLQPMISLVLAAIILNEVLEPVLLLIAAVILSGVWLAQSGGRRRTANLETSK